MQDEEIGRIGVQGLRRMKDQVAEKQQSQERNQQ
jgi:hypothetical protein